MPHPPTHTLSLQVIAAKAALKDMKLSNIEAYDSRISCVPLRLELGTVASLELGTVASLLLQDTTPTPITASLLAHAPPSPSPTPTARSRSGRPRRRWTLARSASW